MRSLQRAECANSYGSQFEVFELSGKDCLDVLRIARDDEPISEDVRLMREYFPTFLLGYYITSRHQVMRQPANVVVLYHPHDVGDT